MPSLKAVKSRITSVKSTQQITRAMKMVAASKLRRAQDRLLQMRPYAEKLTRILNNVSSNLSEENVSEYAKSRDVRNVLFVVFTSDKGLCGAFNTSLFRYLRQLISSQYSTYERNNRLKIMTVGSKGRDYYKRRGHELVDQYTDLFSEQTFGNVRIAAESVMQMYRDGEVDKVVLVYNTFKNVATQVVTNEQILPVESTSEKDEKVTNNIDYIYEPSEEYIVEELIPQSLKIQFYKAYLESAASEQGARMTAMDQATDNAGELLKQLKLTYNRTRQAAITKEILEIVAGADALES
ncbi:ATP synthase F1 subunit gamma [Catalinimonas niigatensis]|uniref:ATP synthase F1 subunit gamma n=1 Tax=Catalinimonas niigatensis TaxID=1397264 RepID=UPI002665FC16|nr:ATP synthase F1 subunit gamma [Catalinimonas niigatensis]WPP52849.1 ATP synthase F1 subunit gamma [Catalinimonas niigatensis]